MLQKVEAPMQEFGYGALRKKNEEKLNIIWQKNVVTGLKIILPICALPTVHNLTFSKISKNEKRTKSLIL